MARTAVVFSPEYYRHNPSRNHPESAKRLHAIVSELKHGELKKERNWEFVSPRKASLEEVELVHGIEYIKLVEAVGKSGGGLLDLQDTVVSRESYEVALHAVGGTLKAVDLVMAGQYSNAFALVRPPGHHASKYRACGFCIFNNVAIAANHLLRKHKLKRILILDIDAHHGNGTQETFYDMSEVLFISLHEDPSSFPGTGFTDEIGEGEGLGFNVNIPLPFETDDSVYAKAMNEIVKPVMVQYDPQFILVSAGFDGHYADPVGNLCLTSTCYQQVFDTVLRVAEEKCDGKLVAVLEGGYNPQVVGKTVAALIVQMSGTQYAMHDRSRRARPRVRKRGLRILEEVKECQRAYWSL
jgi:acetoin utilization deacetylase AcuC-like enzyme